MICIENSYYPCTEITYNLASTCSKPHRERQCIAHLVEIVDWRVRNVGDVTEEPALYDRHVGPQQTHQQGGQHDLLTQVMLFTKGRHEVQDTFRFNVCMFSRVGWFSRKKTGTRQVVTNCSRTEIPKFHFEMLLFYLAQATANFDSFLKMGSPKKIVYVFEREGLLFYA